MEINTTHFAALKWALRTAGGEFGWVQPEPDSMILMGFLIRDDGTVWMPLPDGRLRPVNGYVYPDGAVLSVDAVKDFIKRFKAEAIPIGTVTAS